MSLFCDYNSLVAESDVEQKLIYPFLTSAEPTGLGLDDSQVLTKHVLRQVLIGKTNYKKSRGRERKIVDMITKKYA